MTSKNDHIDRIIEEWSVENSAYDLAPVAVVGRMARIMEYVDQALEDNFDRFGISRASFDVLATLKRSGPPYALTQRELMSNLLRTSGSVSVRIDALERAGLVKRGAVEGDRRTVSVSLTKRGHELLRKVVPEHLRTEDALLDVLEPAQRKQLASLLRKLLASLEQTYESPGVLPLGIRVYSRRGSLYRRKAAGLPDVAGLLVADVLPESVAETIGLRAGDLIIRAGDRVTDTLPALRKALSRNAGRGDLHILRGSERLTITSSRLRQR